MIETTLFIALLALGAMMIGFLVWIARLVFFSDMSEEKKNFCLRFGIVMLVALSLVVALLFQVGQVVF